MEFCAQGSLDKRLYDDNSEISTEQKADWIRQIAGAINHLHEHNIIHRDIAARNILLSNGVAKVSDFGM